MCILFPTNSGGLVTLSSRLFLALSLAPLLVAQTKYQTDLISMSPLGFWPLNNTPNDLSGHGNNGALTGNLPIAPFSTSFTSPVEPNSLILAGGNETFTVPPNPLFNLTALQPMTLTAWIRTDCQGIDTMFILGKADVNTNTGYTLLVDNGALGAPRNGGRLAFALFAAGAPIVLVESTNPVNDGRWRMVTATYDGSGSASGVHLYIDGNNATTTTLASAAGGSILNTSPLTIGNATDGLAPLEGSISGPALFGVALTPAQIVQLATDATAARAILGQFAFGGGWYSAIYFSNGSLNQVSFTVNFIGDDGHPLSVPLLGGAATSSATVTLAPGGSTVLEAPNVGTLNQGYVSVLLPVGVTGYGVFRQSIPGIADQEAVVPLAYPNVTTLTMVYDEINSTTAVAIVNATNAPTSITITVEDVNGNVIGTTAAPLVLQPGTKTEALLRTIPGLSGMAGNRGIAKFTLPSGGAVVLGLRAKGVALTSIPTVGNRVLFDFIGEPFF